MRFIQIFELSIINVEKKSNNSLSNKILLCNKESKIASEVKILSVITCVELLCCAQSCMRKKEIQEKQEIFIPHISSVKVGATPVRCHTFYSGFPEALWCSEYIAPIGGVL